MIRARRFSNPKGLRLLCTAEKTLCTPKARQQITPEKPPTARESVCGRADSRAVRRMGMVSRRGCKSIAIQLVASLYIRGGVGIRRRACLKQRTRHMTDEHTGSPADEPLESCINRKSSESATVCERDHGQRQLALGGRY